MIKVSAPGKIHLLGEHSVVYGKPALLAAINKRVTVTVGKKDQNYPLLRKVVQDLIKKRFKVSKIPDYSIESELPVGSGLGFSAAGSATIIAALLSYFKIKWDKNLVNNLTYEAEKTFHGNPSGGDNSTVVFGGLIWFRKETPDLKIIKPLDFIISSKLSKNFVLINTGKPQESTAEMVEIAKAKIHLILDKQERLVRKLLSVIKEGSEKEFIRIIREGERNLESIGVVSKFAQSIIRKIEKSGGAAKISGAGGKTKGSGILLCYHKNPQKILKYAKQNNLEAFIIKLGEEGLRKENLL